jgi:hypothetical protein
MTGQNKSKFNNNCEFLVGVANVITCPRAQKSSSAIVYYRIWRRNELGCQLQARNMEDIENDGVKIHTG